MYYTCADGSDLKMYKATDVKQDQGIDAMKNAIMSGGPVEVGFDVYSDFMSYKSGIYKQTSSQLLGGHAVKAIGWGVQNGTKYWIMANSWNVKWGESGFFRIAFEECGIEDEVNYGTPVVDSFTSE